MSTATAYAQRPLVLMPHRVQIDLVPAVKEDFKELTGYDRNKQPIYARRLGMIYWLFSQAQAKMMPTLYQVTESTDLWEIKEYIDAGVVFVAKNPFKE